jgi:hypothetical protein
VQCLTVECNIEYYQELEGVDIKNPGASQRVICEDTTVSVRPTNWGHRQGQVRGVDATAGVARGHVPSKQAASTHLFVAVSFLIFAPSLLNDDFSMVVHKIH